MSLIIDWIYARVGCSDGEQFSISSHHIKLAWRILKVQSQVSFKSGIHNTDLSFGFFGRFYKTLSSIKIGARMIFARSRKSRMHKSENYISMYQN